MRMIKKSIWIGLMLALAVLMSAAAVHADEWDKKMVLTFSQPVEIPGRVLPAGTYVFKLANSAIDRHIVQVFNADESQIIATVIAVPRYRATPTDERIITFSEVPAGSTEIIRAWFYPGSNLGQEFVYWKPRATELAKVAKTPVPAIAIDAADLDTLITAPIVAITPDAKEVPLAVAMSTSGVENVAAAPTTRVRQSVQQASQLPRTAGVLSLIVLLGVGSIGVALGLLLWGRPAPAFAKV
jgi:hypothetical protein